MEINKAIMTFSQSEKIKAGLIWVTHTLDILQSLPDGEKKGGQKIIQAMLNMIGHETNLARSVGENGGWAETEACIDRALIMINSGISEEATAHLGMALSKTTNFGQRSMSFLKEKGLL
ncbi:MAG: hypothetical protein V1930_00205 [Pseudomonadota bacterium]